MEAAAIVAIAVPRGEVIPLNELILHRTTEFQSESTEYMETVSDLQDKKTKVDYQDFVGILVLLVINSTISFIEENNAGNAAAALMARLAPKAKVIFKRKLLRHLSCALTFLYIWLFISFKFSTRYCVMINGMKKMQLSWFQETL